MSVRSPVRLVLGALAAALLLACDPAIQPGFKATDVSQVAWGNDFELTAHTGARLNTAELRGRILLLFFGYTHCPDICAPALTKLASLRSKLGEDAGLVQVLFVTVDPARDTPAQLAGFVPRFDPTFIGVTGRPAEIAAVTQDYKVAYQAAPTMQHVHGKPKAAEIDHSGGVFVKDARGRLRLYIREDASLADMLHDVRLLLRER
jgi:protein SCO1/2